MCSAQAASTGQRSDEIRQEALLRTQLSRFLCAEIDRRKFEQAGSLPQTLLVRAGELGLFGLALPSAFGGLELGARVTCSLIEDIAVHDRSFATCIGLHNGLGTRPLVAHGTRAAQEEWLPRLALGDAIASFAATEPQAGSDLTAIRTTLTRGAGGYRLSGEKAYVTNGRLASVVTVLVGSPKADAVRGHSVVLVPTDAPGVTVGAEEDKLGLRASSTTSIHFDLVGVPRDHLLGELGEGVAVTHNALVWGRTLMSAGCVGTSSAALHAAKAHVRARRQFGRRLADFDSVREHLASIAVCDAASRALVLEAARRIDGNEPAHLASAIAKVFSSEAAFDAVDRAIQLHGALGFIEDTGLPAMLRDCRVTRIFEGANDVLLQRIGVDWLASPSLQHELSQASAFIGEQFVEAVERLQTVCETVRADMGVRVLRHQLVLARIAKAVVYVTAARAVAHSADASTAALRAYAVQALTRRATESLAHVWKSSVDERAVRDVCVALLDEREFNAPLTGADEVFP